MELENTSTSSKFRMPPATGLGTSQQVSGSRRTRRWPVRYTQVWDLASSILLRWRSISPARIGGPKESTRRSRISEPAASNFSRLLLWWEYGNTDWAGVFRA